MLIAPLMPGINDSPHQIEPLLEMAGAAGARSIGGIALHLRGEVRDVFMGWLRAQRPDLVDRYEDLYSRGAYAPGRTKAAGFAALRSRGSGKPEVPADPGAPAPREPCARALRAAGAVPSDRRP